MTVNESSSMYWQSEMISHGMKRQESSASCLTTILPSADWSKGFRQKHCGPSTETRYVLVQRQVRDAHH